MSGMFRNVYVAGASSEHQKVSGFADEVRSLGGTITHAWWEPVAAVHAQGLTDEYLSEEIRLLNARKDLEGVLRADLFLILVPDPESATKNGWIELGVTIGLRAVRDQLTPMVWVVGEKQSRRFFSLLADRHFNTESEALSALAEMWGRG